MALLSHGSFSGAAIFRHAATRAPLRSPIRVVIRAVQSAENEKKVADTKEEQKPPPAAAAKPKKPVYSMKKGQIVRVDKEKYLNSVNVIFVSRASAFLQRLDYIYEDRGEALARCWTCAYLRPVNMLL
ncbi:hypothetical protein SASPL_157753 [Salvia splendens]|uniref:Uncharacterized protein n=1 Tax=Salvia splendens TaxID=180675 RepID=A0A8X8YTP2_SALSN|nr:hypothetical protein SASPL_157753 [Salvia splendens]